MPRPKSDNTFQVSFKVPPDWMVEADRVARGMEKREGVPVARAEVLRAALGVGLSVMGRRGRK